MDMEMDIKAPRTHGDYTDSITVRVKFGTWQVLYCMLLTQTQTGCTLSSQLQVEKHGVSKETDKTESSDNKTAKTYIL